MDILPLNSLNSRKKSIESFFIFWIWKKR